MTADAMELRDLLRPKTTAEFFAAHWERQHLLLAREQPGYYDAVITAADLERIVSDPQARYPAIRLAKGGGYLPAQAYTRVHGSGEETFAGVVDVQQLSQEYRRGATVTLPALHTTWAPLARLCAALQRQLDHAVHANAYLTPGNAAGFTPHYDVHNVFVLQIAGHKRWQLYAPMVELPHRSQLCTPQMFAGQPPMVELDLHAGDLLYVPRGVGHSTLTSHSHSAHVTIGVTVYTGVDLLHEVLGVAIHDPASRAALPVGFAHEAALKPALLRTLTEALQRLNSQTDAAGLLDAFTRRVRAVQRAEATPFRAGWAVIDAQTTLQVPPPERYAFAVERDAGVLDLNSVRHRLPAIVAPVVQAMIARGTFRTAELLGGINPDVGLGLSRHLHEIGFLRLADSAPDYET
jgi:ribosomal protein L16 Arg81 hydroxylase